jgi:hypothetical protein
VAKMLSVSPAALRRWRIDERGPTCIKIGSLVRYRLDDLEDWLRSRPERGDRSTHSPRRLRERKSRPSNAKDGGQSHR